MSERRAGPKMHRYPTPLARVLANSYVSPTKRCQGWDGRVTPCLMWAGRRKLNRSGKYYGVIGLRWRRGPRKGRGRAMHAHRYVVVFVLKRRLSERMVVRHLCNETLCVNPYHVSGGRQKTNVRQCVAEGRHKAPRPLGGGRYTEARSTA